MGHAATASRTSVLETAAATLAAVDDLRSLMNTVAVEQGDLKARVAALETRERELAAALELNLAAVRAKADMSAVLLEVRTAEEHAVDAHRRLQTHLTDHKAVSISLWRRLRWLVTGR